MPSLEILTKIGFSQVLISSTKCFENVEEHPSIVHFITDRLIVSFHAFVCSYILYWIVVDIYTVEE